MPKDLIAYFGFCYFFNFIRIIFAETPYGTAAAGGIIYSLSVLFYIFWQDRTESLLQISLFRQVWVVTNYL